MVSLTNTLQPIINVKNGYLYIISIYNMRANTQ